MHSLRGLLVCLEELTLLFAPSPRPEPVHFKISLENDIWLATHDMSLELLQKEQFL